MSAQVPPSLPPRPPAPLPPPPTTTPGLAPGPSPGPSPPQPPPHHPCWQGWMSKYVLLCTTCGGLAALLGALFVVIYCLLRTYTSSLHYFETVPSYVPAIMLLLTGLLVMCFARRRNRYSYLIKVAGGCCLGSAILCVVVVVTTTVVHMNRLQTLRECEYAHKSRSCTCFAGLVETAADESLKYVFADTPDCEVIHGALYSCLRALFGLSVIGILVCIFSCMLVYQLLSHERKKMYWEQLELRCRYLYRHAPQYLYCSCCPDCRCPPPGEPLAWQSWCWSSRAAANLYSLSPRAPRSSVWNWLPWRRQSSPGPTAARLSSRVTPRQVREGPAGDPLVVASQSSSDSQYGFYPCRRRALRPAPGPVPFVTDSSSYCLWGPPPPYSQPPSLTSTSNSTSTSPIREPILALPPHRHLSTQLLAPLDETARREDLAEKQRRRHKGRKEEEEEEEGTKGTGRRQAEQPESELYFADVSSLYYEAAEPADSSASYSCVPAGADLNANPRDGAAASTSRAPEAQGRKRSHSEGEDVLVVVRSVKV